MKTDWKTFLQNAGAVIDEDNDEGNVQHFGNAVREVKIVNTGSIMADLSHFGLIAIYGEDAREFLQGQFTNDLNEISETHSHLSGMCSVKGRLMLLGRIFQRSDTFYLSLSRDILEDTIKKLRLYVLRSKVTLEDATDTFVRIGLSGSNTEEQLKDVIGEIPQNIDDVLQLNNQTVIRIPGIHPRFEIIGEIESMQTLWGKLDVHAAPVGADAWGLIDIHAGIASICKATLDLFVPQMVNLDIVNGISFKKGCYTGQEIVARMHYLGKLKQRMYLAHVNTDEKPEPGSSLYAANSDNKQAIGHIVDAKISADGYHDILAVIKNQYIKNNTICIGSKTGPELILQELPYSIHSPNEPENNTKDAD